MNLGASFHEIVSAILVELCQISNNTFNTGQKYSCADLRLIRVAHKCVKMLHNCLTIQGQAKYDASKSQSFVFQRSNRFQAFVPLHYKLKSRSVKTLQTYQLPPSVNILARPQVRAISFHIYRTRPNRVFINLGTFWWPSFSSFTFIDLIYSNLKI